MHVGFCIRTIWGDEDHQSIEQYARTYTPRSLQTPRVCRCGVHFLRYYKACWGPMCPKRGPKNLPAVFFLCFGWKHRDSRQGSGTKDPQRHEQYGPEEIGRGNDDGNGNRLIDAESILNGFYHAIKLWSNGNRQSQPHWTNDVVEDPEPSVYR